MRVLGVDLGSKRIGLAVSDAEGRLAFPAGVVQSRGRKRDLEAIRKLIRERGVERAVVGIPLHLDGRRGPEAENAAGFARDLARIAGIPVETLDERWTSLEAERLLRTMDTGQRALRERKGAVDEVAASILLRTYLELRGPSQKSAPGPRPSGETP